MKKSVMVIAAMLSALSAPARVMICDSNETVLYTTVGDTLAIESNWHTNREVVLRLSSVWDKSANGHLVINGIEKDAVGANEEKDFTLNLPVSTANKYVCVFTAGSATYSRTIVVSGSRKFPKVTPIAPWGVAIDYDIEGWWGGGVVEVSAIMAGGSVTNVARSLVGDTNCVNGTHRVYWNMAKDGISIEREKILISTKYKAPPPRYCVIDLTEGASAERYPVAYFDAPPSGGFNANEYKTTKLVLRLCPAGVDPLGRYTLTKEFYAGLFEVTQKQWELVMGEDDEVWESLSSTYGKGDAYPIHGVSYDEIHGASIGSEWPASSAVDDGSFIGKLRRKTGLLELDLPTEAQWEYACRAGTTTEYNTGDGETALEEAGWYMYNSSMTTHVVGLKKANAWELYDMHGNVEEWCLDWRSFGDSPTGCDPVGATSGWWRYACGGCFSYYSVTSAFRTGHEPSYRSSSGLGFRLFRTVP